jgi:hypothetical protein
MRGRILRSCSERPDDEDGPFAINGRSEIDELVAMAIQDAY